jgi:hypothetical protein
VSGGIAPELGPGDLQKRPDHAIRPRPDAGEPGGAGAPDQSQQKGLCLIVEGVPDGDRTGIERDRRIAQKAVSGLSRRILQRASRSARERRHVRPPGDERHPASRRQIAAERLVCVCVGAAQLVIQMGRTGDHQRSATLQGPQDVQQRNRVGPARERDEHTSAARKHGVLPHRAQHTGLNGHSFRESGRLSLCAPRLW